MISIGFQIQNKKKNVPEGNASHGQAPAGPTAPCVRRPLLLGRPSSNGRACGAGAPSRISSRSGWPRRSAGRGGVYFFIRQRRRKRSGNQHMISLQSTQKENPEEIQKNHKNQTWSGETMLIRCENQKKP